MNKNGWGLRVELAFLLLFLICLLISTIGLHRLGLIGYDDGVYEDNDGYIEDAVNYDYNSVEKKVTSAAEEYFKNVYSSKTEDSIVVSVDKLQSSGYLDTIRDLRGRKCTGYSIIMNTGNIVSYIKCGLYKTTGYDENYE